MDPQQSQYPDYLDPRLFEDPPTLQLPTEFNAGGFGTPFETAPTQPISLGAGTQQGFGQGIDPPSTTNPYQTQAPVNNHDEGDDNQQFRRYLQLQAEQEAASSLATGQPQPTAEEFSSTNQMALPIRSLRPRNHPFGPGINGEKISAGLMEVWDGTPTNLRTIEYWQCLLDSFRSNPSITAEQWVLSTGAQITEAATYRRQFLGWFGVSKQWYEFFESSSYPFDPENMTKEKWLNMLRHIHRCTPNDWFVHFEWALQMQKKGPELSSALFMPGNQSMEIPSLSNENAIIPEGFKMLTKPFKGDWRDRPDWWGDYVDDSPRRPGESRRTAGRRIYCSRSNMNITRRPLPGIPAPDYTAIEHKERSRMLAAIRRDNEALVVKHNRKMTEWHADFDPEYREKWRQGQRERRAENQRRRVAARQHRARYYVHIAVPVPPDPETPEDSDDDALLDPEKLKRMAWTDAGLGPGNAEKGKSKKPQPAEVDELEEIEGLDDDADEEEEDVIDPAIKGLPGELGRCAPCLKVHRPCDRDLRGYPCGRCIALNKESECVPAMSSIKTRPRANRLRWIPSYSYPAIMDVPVSQKKGKRKVSETSNDDDDDGDGEYGEPPQKKSTKGKKAAQGKTAQGKGAKGGKAPQEKKAPQGKKTAKGKKTTQTNTQDNSTPGDTGPPKRPPSPFEPCDNCKARKTPQWCSKGRPCLACRINKTANTCNGTYQEGPYQGYLNELYLNNPEQHFEQQVEDPPAQTYETYQQGHGEPSYTNTGQSTRPSPYADIHPIDLNPLYASRQPLGMLPGIIPNEISDVRLALVLQDELIGAEDPLYRPALTVSAAHAYRQQQLARQAGPPYATVDPRAGVLQHIEAQNEAEWQRAQAQQAHSPMQELQNANEALATREATLLYDPPMGEMMGVQADIGWALDYGENSDAQGEYGVYGSGQAMASGPDAGVNAIDDFIFTESLANSGLSGSQDEMDLDDVELDLSGPQNVPPEPVGPPNVGPAGFNRPVTWHVHGVKAGHDVDAALWGLEKKRGECTQDLNYWDPTTADVIVCGSVFGYTCDNWQCDNNICRTCRDMQVGVVRVSEARLIDSTKAWFCRTCADAVSHERARVVEGAPQPRMNGCYCVDQLQNTWLCNEDRMNVRMAIEARVAEQGALVGQSGMADLCGNCRNLNADGETKAWRCICCDSIVALP